MATASSRVTFPWHQITAFVVIWLSYIALHSSWTVTDTLMVSTLLPLVAQGHGIDLSILMIGIDLEQTQQSYFLRDNYQQLVGVHPIGMLLFSAPIQALTWVGAWMAGLPIDVTQSSFAGTRFIVEKVSSSFLSALAVVYLYRCLILVGPRPCAIVVTAVYALGSSSLSLLTQGLWQHTGINLLVIMMTHFALDRQRTHSWISEAAFFLGIGLLAAIRPTAILWSLLFAFIYWRLVKRPRAGAVIVALLPIFLTLAWNLSIFHNILGGYGVYPVTVFDARPRELIKRFFLILFSPGRGFVTLHPILLTLVALPLAIRPLAPRERYLVLILLAGIGAQLLLCCTNPQWHGGHNFGPRYMLDQLALCFLLAGLTVGYLMKCMPRTTAVFLCVTACASLVAHLFGAIGDQLPYDALQQMYRAAINP